MAREPLPRGPVNYTEELLAQLVGSQQETNRLLGLLLAQGQAAPGPAQPAPAAITVESAPDGGIKPVPEQSTADPETARPAAAAPVVEESAPEAPGAATVQADGLPPDGEVKPDDRSGTPPAKRPRSR